MRKRSASHDQATFPSPGAPQYRGAGPGLQKGWASERVPPPAPPGRGGGRMGPMMSFSSGRAVPSKWEDAERWICSPLGVKSVASQQQARDKRPKSKSGPIVQCTAAATATAFGHYSPAEGGSSLRSLTAGSPFSTGVLAAESVYGAICCPSPKISVSSESNEEEINAESVSQRDMATQMSPDRDQDCRCSHGKPDQQSSSHDVRDVQVDKRAVAIRWSRKRGKKGQTRNVNDFVENRLDISRAAINDSRCQREEAKISAWENLQKAKAEAAIRKLEMKLEKKRSATMDKIVDKLRTAEFKAHKMRTKLSDNNIDDDREQTYEVIPRIPPKSFSFRKHVLGKSLGRLFMCRRSF